MSTLDCYLPDTFARGSCAQHGCPHLVSPISRRAVLGVAFQSTFLGVEKAGVISARSAAAFAGQTSSKISFRV